MCRNSVASWATGALLCKLRVTNGLALQIPNLEQVGQLRQVSPPRNGREYWMAFSNKGRSIKRGSHVTVIIGGLRINGLVVE